MIVNRHMQTPLGPMRITGDGHMVTGLHFWDQKRAPLEAPVDQEAFAEAVQQIDEWFAGTRQSFDLALAPAGSEFQLKVWEALGQVPFGQTVSYAEVARAVGRPGAARACGHAIGRNPVAIVVPCHRVIGTGGALTGYAAGLHRKRWMLEHERSCL